MPCKLNKITACTVLTSLKPSFPYSVLSELCSSCVTALLPKQSCHRCRLKEGFLDPFTRVVEVSGRQQGPCDAARQLLARGPVMRLQSWTPAGSARGLGFVVGYQIAIVDSERPHIIDTGIKYADCSSSRHHTSPSEPRHPTCRARGGDGPVRTSGYCVTVSA